MIFRAVELTKTFKTTNMEYYLGFNRKDFFKRSMSLRLEIPENVKFLLTRHPVLINALDYNGEPVTSEISNEKFHCTLRINELPNETDITWQITPQNDHRNLKIHYSDETGHINFHFIYNLRKDDFDQLVLFEAAQYNGLRVSIAAEWDEDLQSPLFFDRYHDPKFSLLTWDLAAYPRNWINIGDIEFDFGFDLKPREISLKY